MTELPEVSVDSGWSDKVAEPLSPLSESPCCSGKNVSELLDVKLSELVSDWVDEEPEYT